MSDYLPGGNPLSYWQRPPGERWKHWARPGVKIWLPRNGQLVLVWDGEKEVGQDYATKPQTMASFAPRNGEKSDKVSNDHVTPLTRPYRPERAPVQASQRFCKECGKPLPAHADGQRQYCNGACRTRACREKTGRKSVLQPIS